MSDITLCFKLDKPLVGIRFFKCNAMTLLRMSCLYDKRLDFFTLKCSFNAFCVRHVINRTKHLFFCFIFKFNKLVAKK